MALFDFSETDNLFENLFGKVVYKWLNILVRVIAIIGIVLCVLAYFLGMEGIFNLYTVGSTLLILIVGAIVIAGVIRCISWLMSR